jgi:hypothetical protein
MQSRNSSQHPLYQRYAKPQKSAVSPDDACDCTLSLLPSERYHDTPGQLMPTASIVGRISAAMGLDQQPHFLGCLSHYSLL